MAHYPVGRPGFVERPAARGPRTQDHAPPQEGAARRARRGILREPRPRTAGAAPRHTRLSHPLLANFPYNHVQCFYVGSMLEVVRGHGVIQPFRAAYHETNHCQVGHRGHIRRSSRRTRRTCASRQRLSYSRASLGSLRTISSVRAPLRTPYYLSLQWPWKRIEFQQ